MKRINNEVLEKVDDQIWGGREFIAKELECEPLFGAVGGSISLNLANESSDIDFYLITERQKKRDILQSVYVDNIKVDFMCVTIEELLEECRFFDNKMRRYPTRFYRSQSEETAVQQKKDTERPDFKREMVMRIFLADEILEFKPSATEDVYEKLKPVLALIDIWDYHFNRAYGNYYENIKGKNNVLLRKYLYVINQITVCRVLAGKGRVFLDSSRLMDGTVSIYMDDEIRRICRHLRNKNQKEVVGKSKSYVEAVPLLNNWIEENLGKAMSDMKENEQFLRENYYKYDVDKVMRVSTVMTSGEKLTF